MGVNMEGKVRVWRILIGFSCMLFLIFGIAASTNVKAAKIEESKEQTVKSDRMIMTITYGYGKYVKYGRYMGIHASVTNLGENFSGKICARVPNTNQKSILYSKNISIAKGETKEIEFAIPATFTNGFLNLSIVDEKETTMLKKKVRLTVENNIQVAYAGILSDEYASLNYLANEKTRTFLLKADTFPKDAKALDMLDIILINNFNTSKLNNEQYEALKKFVENGGTLILGTGSTANKTLKLFQDDFLTGTMKELTKQTFYLDNKKEVKITKDVQNIILEDSKTLLKQDDKQYVQKKAFGLGSICLFQFDLSLEQKLWGTAGEEIASLIEKVFSKAKQEQLEKEYMGDYSPYNITNSLNVVDSKDTPKVSNYAIVLVMYLLIIGPPVYFVLKKIDKRNYMWVWIPACSILFTIIIYFMGSNTRIKEPIMNFMTITKVADNSAQEETHFQIMTPSNQTYELNVPAEYSLTADSAEAWYSGEEELPDYSVEVNYGAEKNKITMKNNSAFESSKFKVMGVKRMDGTIIGNIKFDHFKYEGTVTNDSEYDLKDAIAVFDNIAYKIGDFKAGETKNLKDCKAFKYNMNAVYRDRLTSRLLNGEPQDTNDANYKRKFYTMEYYLAENAFKGVNEVFGFVDNSKESILNNSSIKKQGIHLFSFPVNVNYQKGNETMIPNISSYYELVEGDYEYNNTIYEPVTFKAQFDKNDNITSLIYSKELNSEFDHSQTNGGFYGKILAYNYNTKVYDTIFESQTEGVLNNLKPYLNNDNTLIIQIIPENKKQNYADREIYIPTLSVTKEVK